MKCRGSATLTGTKHWNLSCSFIMPFENFRWNAAFVSKQASCHTHTSKTGHRNVPKIWITNSEIKTIYSLNTWQVGDRTAELSEYRGDRTDPLPVGRCTPALAPLTAPCASCEDLTMRDSPEEEEEVGRVFTSPVFQIPSHGIRTRFRAYSWKKKKK
jgi:hypothetical protein